MGTQPYSQWINTDLNNNTKPTGNPYTDQNSVTPRHNDSRVPERKNHCIIYTDLDQGTNDAQWENAISLFKEEKITKITITSWNEFPERTAIEHHHDAVAKNPDPGFFTTKQEIILWKHERQQNENPTVTQHKHNNSQKLRVKNITHELQTVKMIFNKDVEFIKVKKENAHTLKHVSCSSSLCIWCNSS